METSSIKHVLVERLEPESYPVLENVADGVVPDPRTSIAIVAREDHEIVGRAFIMVPAHLEGPWVAERLRGSTLAHRVVVRAEEEARKQGISRLFAYAVDDVIEGYLHRIGYARQPMTVWAKDL